MEDDSSPLSGASPIAEKRLPAHTDSPSTVVPPLVRTDMTASPLPSQATDNNSFGIGVSGSAPRRRSNGTSLPPLPTPIGARPSVSTSPNTLHLNYPGTTTASFSRIAATYVGSNAIASSGPSAEASGADEAEPILTNGSLALAEFTSLLKPTENNNMLREHIIHLLRDVDTEDTLVRIARALEAQGGTQGRGSPDDVSSTTWVDSARMTPTMTNPSHSTGGSASMSTTNRRRSSAMGPQDAVSFEALAGLSFLHPRARQGSTRDSPSSMQPSEDTVGYGRSLRGLGAPTDVSFRSHSSRGGREEEHARSSRRSSGRKSRDEAALSSLMTTQGSQLGETAVGLRTDPLLREIPVLPAAVRNEGRRVAVSAASCMPPPELFAGGSDGDGAADREEKAGVAGDAAAEEDVGPLHPPMRVIAKAPAEEQQLRRLVRRCHSFASLEVDIMEDVVRAMEREVHAAGAAILEQGQDSSDKMYMVAEGTCEAIKNGKAMGPLQPGGTFGELELMYKQAKCAATIRCVTRCVLYSLDEASYHRAVMTNSLQKRKKFEALTLNVPFLRCMPDFERMKIAEALVTRQFRRGQAIIKFGSSGTYMHFVVQGEVKVIGRNNGRRVEVVRLHAGDVVGELEFLFNHLTVADVVATSHRVVTACISREHFELIIGPIQDRLKEFVATSATYEKYYLAEVAGESVRSELRSIESTRKHRRVASREDAFTLEEISAEGEVVLSAPLALLSGRGNKGGEEAGSGSPSSAFDKLRRGHRAGDGDHRLASTTAVLDEVARESVQLPKAVLRFPFSPVTGKDVAVLAMREDGLIMYWNAVLERLTKYPAEEVVGQNIYSFLLAEREQHSMLKAIMAARNCAGDVEAFLERPGNKAHSFTLARSDGLTKATLQLTVVPPVVSAGGDAAEVVLGFGTEVKQGPQRMLEQPQWLSAQVRTILADGTLTYEERLEYIAETLNNFEATYRAMTVSTERLRVVNVRQMVGHVLMDFGSDFVTRGVSVRQRFEGLPADRAYLDADLLPECLRYAMMLCLKFSPAGGSIVTIMITASEKNGLEFLIINFNVSGNGLPEAIAAFFDAPFGQHGLDSSTADESSADDTSDEDFDVEELEDHSGTNSATPARALPPRLRRKLRRVQRAVEEQGGTLRIQRNAEDANIVFLIPFMPAGEGDAELGMMEESLPSLAESSSPSVSLNAAPGRAGQSGSPAAAGVTAGNSIHTNNHSSNVTLLPQEPHRLPGDVGSVSSPTTPREVSEALNGSAGANQPSFSYTTCLAEDTPAHRIMLSAFLWERRHAVLTAFKFEDVVKLFGVADILIIDLQQSVITSLHDDDPINRLREMLRHMAVIITATSFDLVSSETYEAAGFITLKKPCTPVNAMKAIRRAEEKSAVVKLERLRIEQTRETLARNSRGAWRRGALLGKGSFGEVYEACDVLTGGKMAVKEMRLGGNNTKIEQFVQEISTMCNLQHPNIIHYFYCEESKEQKAIRVFMEYAGGGTLQSLLKKKGKLDFAELRALLRDVVEGLAYIHSQHYVHGDIKTANVLLNTEGKGKIGDFGTARTVHDDELIYVMQGSPLYMSPECMSAGEEDEDGNRIGYSFPSDIWSLGCVAMEMVTTKPPFSHIKTIKGPAGLTNYITSLIDVPDLSPLFKSEPTVVEFVSACLNPDPAQRATAQDLLQMNLFSESTHSDRNSAVKALKRAQLLHVLNKFVAFQEPEVTNALEKRRNRFKVRRRSSDFFSSGSEDDGDKKAIRKKTDGASGRVSTTSSSSSAASAVPGSAQAVPKSEKTAGAKQGKGEDDSDSEAPRRSETVACVGEEEGGEKGGPSSTAWTQSPAAAAADMSATAPGAPQTRHGDAQDCTFTRTLRQWHSDSSSAASSTSSSEAAGRSPVGAEQTMSLAEPAPLDTQASTNSVHRPRHRDPVAAAVANEEPDARDPQLADAYDLSPTPKKRSKTQSRPPAAQAEEPTTTSIIAPKRLLPGMSTSSSSSSSSTGGSGSTNSAEAAFFDTSSSDVSRSASSSPMVAGPTDTTPAAAKREESTVVSLLNVIRAVPAAAGAVPLLPVQLGSAAVSQVTGSLSTPTSMREMAAPADTKPPAGKHPAILTTTTTASASIQRAGVTLASHLPTFTGRRGNVTMDEDGNIVPFQHFVSSASVATSKDSRAGTATIASQGSSELGPSAVSRHAASPLGDMPPLSPSVGGTIAAGGGRPGTPSHGLGAGPPLSSPVATVPALTSGGGGGGGGNVTNTSFTAPPNMSFFNYSFNKNISFMGANMDEVLNSAANDFLTSLAANNGNLHTSSVVSGETHRTASRAPEPLSNAQSSGDLEAVTESVPMFSCPLVPDTPTDSGSGSVRGSRTAQPQPMSVDAPLSDNSGVGGGDPHTVTVMQRSLDGTVACGGGNWAVPTDPNTTPSSHASSNNSTSNSGSSAHLQRSPHHRSPAPQVPSVRQRGRATTSAAGTEASASTSSTRSGTPRGDSVSLVGTTAVSSTRRPQRMRPPITNQSFFVIEDRHLPSVFGTSQATPAASFIPLASSSAVPNYSFSAAPMSMMVAAAVAVAAGQSAAMSSVSGQSNIMNSAALSMPGESANTLFYPPPQVAVVAPPPGCSSLSSALSVREAWKRRHRLPPDSHPALSTAGFPMGGGGQGMDGPLEDLNSMDLGVGKHAPSEKAPTLAQTGAAAGRAGMGISGRLNSCDDEVLSSAAFGSFLSGSSWQSCPRVTPYLTAERLKQMARGEEISTGKEEGDTPLISLTTPHPQNHQDVPVFSTLMSNEESPLFTYLKRMNQSLRNVAAQLQTRRRAGSETVPSTLLNSVNSIERASSMQMTGSHTIQPSSAGGAVAVQAPPTPGTTIGSPLRCTAAPPGSHLTSPTTEFAALVVADRKGSGGGGGITANRSSLPRPLSTPKAARPARSTPVVGPQLDHGHPLWSSLERADAPIAASPLQLPRTNAALTAGDSVERGEGIGEAAPQVTRGPSTESDGNAAIEDLLHRMLSQVNALLDQVAHLQPTGASTPLAAFPPTASTSTNSVRSS